MVNSFKNTEFGMIPNDWDYRSIENDIDLLTGFPFPSNEYAENGTKLLRCSNVKRGVTDWNEAITKYWKEVSFELKNYLLQEGDIVIAMDGSLVGKSFARLSKKDLPALLLQRVARIRSTKIDVGYLKEFICSEYFTRHCNIVKTASAIPHISPKDIRTFKIPLPPTKAEQTKIASTLNDTNNLIAELKKLLLKKRNIKVGAIQELLKPKEDWEMKKLGEIGECIIGLTYSPSNVKKEGKLVLRSSNIKGNKLVFDDNVFVDVQVSQRLIVEKGDVLICVRNGSRNLIGKCAYIDGRAIGETFGAFMSVFRSPYNDYVFHVFQSNHIHRQIEETIGATINQLTNKNLNSFEIPFPNPDERKHIAKILSDMDNEIQEIEKQLEKHKMMKQGIMQNLLTGKIRLTK